MIPNGVHIHQSVVDRIRGVPSYKPKNLPQQYVTEPETFVRTGAATSA